MAEVADVVIVGGGMAGASLAYFLAPHARIMLLERETELAYHTTGRSAAMYLKTYGNEVIRALTVAGEAFYLEPPEGFCNAPLLTPRGALQFATEAQLPGLERTLAEVRVLAPATARLTVDVWSSSTSAISAIRSGRIAERPRSRNARW